MKVFVIDPFANEIREAEVTDAREDIDGFLHDLYREMKCELLDAVRIDEDGDVIFVDDEGLFKEDQRYFRTLFYAGGPLAGISVVCGTDKRGHSTTPNISKKQLEYTTLFQPKV